MKYSVLMSVYIKDNPKWLKEALDSIKNQTIKPFEFVIVKDGPLTDDLNKVIDDLEKEYNTKVIALKENVGLGKALNTGINHCSNELIARMDADDISNKMRIEKQMKIFENNPDICIVGTQVSEFIDEVENVVTNNYFPVSHDEIVKYAHSRNPFSHSSILFKKSKVIKAGNYQDAYLCEDYDLWIRMILNDYKCANCDEILHYVRVNKDFYKRRGGIKYVKSINNLMAKYSFFTKKDYISNMLVRTTVYLMPNSLREFVYKNILRKGVKKND